MPNHFIERIKKHGHTKYSPEKLTKSIIKEKLIFGDKRHILNTLLRPLPKSRERKYHILSKKIGNTEIDEVHLKNNNILHIKRELDNLYGSHYDRVYLYLFRYYEAAGFIKPGQKILETTSGSAGVSFAGIGTKLGYDCYVAIPKGGEKAREEAIKKVGGKLIYTDASKYIAGFPEFLKNFLKEHNDLFFLNHSMGPKKTNNAITLLALEEIALEYVKKQGIPDIYVPAVGNGSSVLGPGRIFKKLNPNMKIFCFETFQSGVTYDLIFRDYAKKYGIKPGTLSRHMLPGTSFVGIDFPHIRESLKYIDNVFLIWDKKQLEEYFKKTGKKPKNALRWDVLELKDYGRTTLAGISISNYLAEHLKNKQILILGYDSKTRYDKLIP